MERRAKVELFEEIRREHEFGSGTIKGVARRLALKAEDSFWQARYYDFNVWSEKNFVEKLRYIHRNPVGRGLVALPED